MPSDRAGAQGYVVREGSFGSYLGGMKNESKYFDSIRVKRGQREKAASHAPGCQWKGCTGVGNHRAPKGRGRDGEYFMFCMDHVRQFNATYNYFDGMSNAEVEDFQKSALTGHRPTWKLGENAAAAGREIPPGLQGHGRFTHTAGSDPHEILEGSEDASPAQPRRRSLRTLERRALDALHLTETASKADIKTRFKELVKRHHPDANGGDRGSEDKLREIIQAYNYLKQAGLV
jgi:hypothetical protein